MVQNYLIKMVLFFFIFTILIINSFPNDVDAFFFNHKLKFKFLTIDCFLQYVNHGTFQNSNYCRIEQTIFGFNYKTLDIIYVYINRYAHNITMIIKNYKYYGLISNLTCKIRYSLINELFINKLAIRKV